MLSKHLKRFFSFNVETFNMYKKLFPPNHASICVVGSDLPGLVVSSLLPTSTGISGTYIRMFAHKNFASLDRFELLGSNLKEREEMNIPVLKLLNEYINVEFDNVLEFSPKTNTLKTLDKEFTYDELIISSQTIPNLEAIPGLKNAFYDSYNCVSGLYDYDSSEKTARILENYRLGYIPKHIVFYNHGDSKQDYYSLLNLVLLFEEKLRISKNDYRNSTEITYIAKDITVYPGNERFDKYLHDLLNKKGINVIINTELTELDEQNSKLHLKADGGKKIEMNFGVLIAEPPYELPLNIKKSPFVNTNGTLDFDKDLLIHSEYKNVFTIGPSLFPYQNLNSFYEQGMTIGNNIMLNILNQDHPKNKIPYFKYKNYANIPIYRGNKKITRLISDDKKEEIKEEGLKAYVWETYGQTEIIKRLMQNGKWFGKTKLFKPHIILPSV